MAKESAPVPSFHDNYTPLEVIGSGSFGLIRKVQRKSDGLTLARKELHFERMSERDRKQLVAEVNILKDLHHEHIVQYHDRHVDQGTLHILMEFCGGGDLASLIRQAAKHGRPIPEDTVWNYFMQILLALHYCHHPGEPNARATKGAQGGKKRHQILHRDIKPDNILLDGKNTIKLGDFGLSKALVQATFADTYVGTPYYMSPELIESKCYDSKSDIWALGCLVYELCALNPPFAEAQTQAELNIFIRNGRVPPLPKGYSPALWNVIKSMLNVNPTLRPSASELLHHDRIEVIFKVSETERMLSAVKSHKATLLAREDELRVREARLAEVLASKDAALRDLRARQKASEDENAELRNVIAQQSARIEEQSKLLQDQSEHQLKLQREHEASLAALITHANSAWAAREAEIQEAWAARESEIRDEMVALFDARAQLSAETQRLTKEFGGTDIDTVAPGDVKEGLQSLTRIVEALDTPVRISSSDRKPKAKALPRHLRPSTETPLRSQPGYAPASAMKGVVLTSTGEPLTTPTPSELAQLFAGTPSPSLRTDRFSFDSPREDDDEEAPASPSERGRPRIQRCATVVATQGNGSRQQSGHTRQRLMSDRPTNAVLPPSTSAPDIFSSITKIDKAKDGVFAELGQSDLWEEENQPVVIMPRRHKSTLSYDQR
ncbi:hypothetical protein PLICRDRAFT_114968 [Plicaturopsis crispa FD-325 SS-3]|nr:hypothetical protein PLICRDRAFT_114968 [Plicaturopsis crispa FD-325 SS-3]